MRKELGDRLLGCSYDKQRKKWKARIYINGRRHFLGYWDTEEEASDAYIAALAAKRHALPNPKENHP
jgi:hypothetical protein